MQEAIRAWGRFSGEIKQGPFTLNEEGGRALVLIQRLGQWSPAN